MSTLRLQTAAALATFVLFVLCLEASYAQQPNNQQCYAINGDCTGGLNNGQCNPISELCGTTQMNFVSCTGVSPLTRCSQLTYANCTSLPNYTCATFNLYVTRDAQGNCTGNFCTWTWIEHNLDCQNPDHTNPS